MHALKSGASIWLPLYPEVKRALDCLPVPQGASADCDYFFWSEFGSRHEHIKTVTRTLKAVFKASGVRNAHAHRFRHTLATEILIIGGMIEDCANILGDSPEIIRKHYAKCELCGWVVDFAHLNPLVIGVSREYNQVLISS